MTKQMLEYLNSLVENLQQQTTTKKPQPQQISRNAIVGQQTKTTQQQNSPERTLHNAPPQLQTRETFKQYSNKLNLNDDYNDVANRFDIFVATLNLPQNGAHSPLEMPNRGQTPIAHFNALSAPPYALQNTPTSHSPVRRTSTTTHNNNDYNYNNYDQNNNNHNRNHNNATVEAHLSCASGEMELKLSFAEPFRGIVYADQNRRSACRLTGDGAKTYELRLPLRGCGTRQVSSFPLRFRFAGRAVH